MSDTAAATTKPVIENKSFTDILKALVGKVVTIVNAESYENAPMGHQIRAGFYKGKVAGLGHDYLIIVTEFSPKGTGDGKEPVKQFVPLSAIKRLSLMKSEMLLHL